MTARLARVELRRYLTRAGVRWLVVAMLVAVLLTAFTAWRTSRPPTPEQLAQAQQQVASMQADWELHGEEVVADCRARQQEARQSDPAADFGCDRMAPTVAQFLPQRQSFAEAAQGWLDQVATFVLLLALIVGATFVAAEFSTGAMTTWLTFEPRRGWVFASKAVVAAVATGVAAFVVSALAVGATWAATALNHATGDPAARIVADLASSAGRIGGAAAGAALLGAALGFLLRHTAAVLAAVVGWFVAVDGLLLNGMLQAPRWSVTTNLQAWLHGGTTYYQQQPCVLDPGGNGYSCGSLAKSLSMTSGGLALVVAAVLVTALALLVFRRRDLA